MFSSLKNLFKQSDNNSGSNRDNEDLFLLSGLMIEAASTDGKIDEIEINKISILLIEIFKENSQDVEEIIKKCIKEIDEPKSLHFFTSKINKNFDNIKKTLLIEALWEIILADGLVHEFESNLIRRLAGLLYISDVSCGNAKKRVLLKLNSKTEV